MQYRWTHSGTEYRLLHSQAQWPLRQGTTSPSNCRKIQILGWIFKIFSWVMFLRILPILDGTTMGIGVPVPQQIFTGVTRMKNPKIFSPILPLWEWSTFPKPLYHQLYNRGLTPGNIVAGINKAFWENCYAPDLVIPILPILGLLGLAEWGRGMRLTDFNCGWIALFQLSSILWQMLQSQCKLVWRCCL